MKKILSSFLCMIISLGLFTSSIFAAENDIDIVVSNVGKYIYQTVANPQVGSIGGEWSVIGLARSGMEIPDKYYEKYYQTAERYVKENNGILHDKKYTEYSRLILALTAIGQNPENIGGYNLLLPLSDFDKTVWQGVNGAVWALIALDSLQYDIPYNTSLSITATRENYVSHILDSQNPDGGWSLSSSDSSDPDMTSMALQALAKYQNDEKVLNSIDEALKFISESQNSSGGFTTKYGETVESTAQTITALCELNISIDDSRFVKNGVTLLDNLLSYYIQGEGFKHTQKDNSTNMMATEQCFYALIDLKRINENKNSLYDMSDAISFTASTSSVGLPDKHPDIKRMPLENPYITFTDIQGHINQASIEALAARNIINGKSENRFEPDSTMTRAEFAAIITRSLGLPQKDDNGIFNDVSPESWYFTYINTAYFYDIINGISDLEFAPNGTITRQEAAVMTARAASLCGIDTNMDTIAVRDTLAAFTDYVKAADWSQSSLAFCYNNKILSDEMLAIKPQEAVTRAEITSMLYNTLFLANLL